MSHLRIPANWKVKRSTPFSPKKMFRRHAFITTQRQAFRTTLRWKGTVTYYGFANETATEPEVKVVINAGQFANSPPQYRHRVELSDDARFNIHFCRGRPSGEEMYQQQPDIGKPVSPLGGVPPSSRVLMAPSKR